MNINSDAIQAELALLRAENARLKSGKALTFKVSDKGGVSVYGLGRFPVTLYAQQWHKLLAMKDGIEAFIVENSASLTTKE